MRSACSEVHETIALGGQDSWFQEAYGTNPDQPSTQIAQGLLFEVE